MPCEIKVYDKEGIVQMRLEGIVGKEEVRQARTNAGQALRQGGYRRLLVDLSDFVVAGSSTLGSFDFATGFQESGIPASARIAHVLPKDPNERSNVQFITTVAFNRGFQVREFETLEEARKWVLEDHR